MPATIIPSITEGLLSSLSHMPPQTATKDVLRGHTARPRRCFRSQALRSSLPLPELWHLSVSHSSSFACHRPLSLPFAGSHNSFEKTLSNHLGFNSDAILICLNVTLIFLLLHFLLGTKLVLTEEVLSPTPPWTVRIPLFSFSEFFSSFTLFLPFLSVNSITRFCTWQCLLHSPKNAPFLLLIVKNTISGIRQICILMPRLTYLSCSPQL